MTTTPTEPTAAEARAFLTGHWGGEPSYGRGYLEVFPEYAENELGHEDKVDGVIHCIRENNLDLPLGSSILLLGAGHGPHDIPLARHGFRVVGLDILYGPLKIAHDRAAEAGINVDHVVADMTSSLPFRANSMNGVFILGSSFGFYESDSTNAAVFQFGAQVLQKSGVFVLDYVNGRRLLDLGCRRRVTTLPNGSSRVEEYTYSVENQSGFGKITLKRVDGREVTFYHYMKYYTLEQVRQMMTATGLRPINVYGDVHGQDFDPDHSNQMVIIATKRV